MLNMNNQSKLIQMPQCIAYAVAATIFWKKSFRKEHIKLVLYYAGLGAVMDLNGCSMLTGLMLTFGIHVYIRYGSTLLDNVFKKSMFFTSLLAIADVKYGLVENAFQNSRLPSWLVTLISGGGWKLCRIALSAAFQFIREPLWLKTKLQGVRSKLGPIFVLSVLDFAASVVTDNSMVMMLRYIASLAALLGGILFRPDNSTILNVIGKRMNRIERKNFHKKCMVCSCTAVVLISVVRFFKWRLHSIWRVRHDNFFMRICIVRCLYCINHRNAHLWKFYLKKSVLFCQTAEVFLFFCQLEGEKEHLLQ